MQLSGAPVSEITLDSGIAAQLPALEEAALQAVNLVLTSRAPPAFAALTALEVSNAADVTIAAALPRLQRLRL